MITTTWNWLWKKHNQTKDLFTFFVKPQSSNLATGRSIDPSHSKKNGNGNGTYKPIQKIGLILGPLLFFLILFFFSPEGLSKEGIGVLASTTWIAVWWMTEAIPIPAASLLPIVLFPLLGSLTIEETTAAYGSDVIFLFMGGFMIALAMEKWDLHRRIALNIISIIGTNTDRIILGFMIATGFLSMFISNTATALMMVPIGLAVIYQISEALKDHPSIDTSKENFGFGKALMLSIAYSASIGGVATLIGTPPNAVLAGVIKKTYGIELSFAKWMMFGVPVAIVFMFVAWFYLVKIAYPLKVKEMPGGKEVIDEEKEKLGAPSFEEKSVFFIFILAALSWIFRSAILEKIIPNINDAIIAMTFAIILFLIPSKNKEGDRLLDWNTAVKLPWGILLLFGGGLAIAEGFSTSGLSEWFGGQLTALQGINIVVVLLVVSALVLFLTEITSNTATATMMYPIMISLAVALEIHPYAVMVAAAVSASCAFMLPVATPPNAVVFGSGYLRIPDMAKAGLLLNIVGTFIITLAVYYLLPIVWGIDITELPVEFLKPQSILD
ncbi:MAG TPA: DASS family sodium-coupled anion symporter [Bacillota bacterium]